MFFIVKQNHQNFIGLVLSQVIRKLLSLMEKKWEEVNPIYIYNTSVLFSVH